MSVKKLKLFSKGLLIINFRNLVTVGLVVFVFSLSYSILSPRLRPSLESSLQQVINSCQALKEDKIGVEGCYKAQFQKLMLRYGSDPVLTVYGRLSSGAYQQDDTVKCHLSAHLAGEVAAEQSSNIGRTIASCSRDCGFGCIHGVFLGAMSLKPELLDNLSSICNIFSNQDFPGQELTACRHGLGHGIVEYSSRDLTRSLQLCDKLDNNGGKIECATGVFMEILDSQPPNSQTGFKLPDDINGFCRSLPSLYADTCSKNSGGYEYRRSKDLVKAWLNCRQLPTPLASDCASGLGSDWHFIFTGDEQKVWESCSTGSSSEIPYCLQGALVSTLVTDPQGTVGSKLCSISTDPFRKGCFRYLGNSIFRLKNLSEGELFCAKINQFPDRQACQEGLH